MKLATLRDGTRDGELVVVSRDLSRCVPGPITSLQGTLDRWDEVEAPLHNVYRALNAGEQHADVKCGGAADRGDGMGGASGINQFFFEPTNILTNRRHPTGVEAVLDV